MNKEWRPERWNAHIQIREIPMYLGLNREGIYEAGAGAMLKAIKDNAVKFEEKFVITVTPLSRKDTPPKGFLIFIPNEVK